MRRTVLRVVTVVAALSAAGAAGGGGAATPTLRFTSFAHLTPKMDSVVWTGTRFLYVENTANAVWSAPAAGGPIARFATMPRLSEETRCVRSPGTHGWRAGVFFCHSPDHRIYELAGNGAVRVFARLPAPYPPAGDGALAFDTVGRFGYRLVAATGRSGAGQPPGGIVCTIDRAGSVRRVGSYPGPGGADELAIAPAGFGSAGGDALLTIDAGKGRGALAAMSPRGHARVLAHLPDGPNPIVVLEPHGRLFLTEDTSQDVYTARAPTGHPGEVLVGGEVSGAFWLVRPHGPGFSVEDVGSNLTGSARGLEQMIELPSMPR